VPSFDLSAWIAQAFEPADEVVLKLNVEGAEYAVLEKMIRDGTILRIGRLYVDWHGQWIDNPQVTETAAFVQGWLRTSGIPVHPWETHGLQGKLVERPTDMQAVARWQRPV